jgi:hypothetical protein
MLIHPWDGAISDTEWRDWLAGHDFGQLAVSDPGNGAPYVIPTHFVVDGDTLLVHLARPNQVWAAIQARPTVVMSVVDRSLPQMHERSTRTTASVDSCSFGSGTSCTRTSPAPYIKVARMRSVSPLTVEMSLLCFLTGWRCRAGYHQVTAPGADKGVPVFPGNGSASLRTPRAPTVKSWTIERRFVSSSPPGGRESPPSRQACPPTAATAG